MHQLGQTRSVHCRDHAVFTSDTFVRAPLPGMAKATAIIHAAPQIGAAFPQYTAELEDGGCLGHLPASCERFVFVLDGEVRVDFSKEVHGLGKSEFAYIPPGVDHAVRSVSPARLAII